MDKVNTFIFTPIRSDLIHRALETLYKHTPPNFYVIVVDQTIEGLGALREQFSDLMVIRTPLTDVHYTGNLGFQQANNLAIRLVETPYFTLVNDDVEFINEKWWQGTLDAFDTVDAATPETPCLMVCPGSIKLPDWSVGRPSGDDFYIVPYKETYSETEYDDLVTQPHYVNEHLTLMPGSVIDGVTLYCPVIKTSLFLDVGYLDEIYFPGGAGDYDFACRLSLKGYRGVGTTMSWVFHHWSKSLSAADSLQIRERLSTPELEMGDHNKVWGYDEDGKPYHDIWGTRCRICDSRLHTDDNITAYCKNDDYQFKIPPPTFRPL